MYKQIFRSIQAQPVLVGGALSSSPCPERLGERGERKIAQAGDCDLGIPVFVVSEVLLKVLLCCFMDKADTAFFIQATNPAQSEITFSIFNKSLSSIFLLLSLTARACRSSTRQDGGVECDPLQCSYGNFDVLAFWMSPYPFNCPIVRLVQTIGQSVQGTQDVMFVRLVVQKFDMEGSHQEPISIRIDFLGEVNIPSAFFTIISTTVDRRFSSVFTISHKYNDSSI